MNRKHVSKMGKYIGMACLLFVCATVQSCRDEYYYDDREPDFLGSSIYDYLQEQGNFTYFLKVIDDLGYAEVLKKTGSKTLFVADDAAFMKGVKAEWGIKNYADLTSAHKRVILYGAMLDNAYLLEMLSKMQSTGINAEPVSGKSIRRATSASVVDTIGLFDYSALPKNNPDWDVFNPNSDKFRYPNVRLALDATEPLMLYLMQDYLYQNSIKESDLRWMVGDQTASWSDVYVFDRKVLKDKSDVVCKNGYVHQLDGLLIPPSNMAEELRLNGDKGMLESGILDCDALANNDSTTMLFSRMLDRYSVPVPIDAQSQIATDFYRNYGGDGVVEQLYEKRFYTEGTNRGASVDFKAYEDVDKMVHKASGSLLFDPGWNAYSGSSKEMDMAAIFAPSDKAVIAFFKDIETGKNLIRRYGANVPDPFGSGLVQAIDSIPVDILQALVRNHMQVSFIGAVPSKFDLVMNDARDQLGLSMEDISHTMLTNNGVVYVMKKLYSPARYESVIAPVMLDDTLSIFNKFIEDNDYDHYLLSMGNKFSLISTADTSMVYYSPETDVKEKNKREAFRFEASRDKEGNLIVQAKVYEYDNGTYDPVTNTYTLSKTSNSTKALSSTANNLMKEILEYNIVVGDMNSEEDCNSGKKYYMAKGYGTVMVKRGKDGFGRVTAIAGGRERQNGTWIPVGEEDAVDMENGHTFKLRTSMIQPPTQSVYKVFEQTPEYQRFFDLCKVDPEIMRMVYGTDDEKWEKFRVFTTSNSVRMFDTYHYTIYVPDSASLDYAFEHEGLPSWVQLRAEFDAIKQLPASESARKKVMQDSLRAGVELLLKFVNYHFQDNSVYADVPPHALEIDGQEAMEYKVNYETSALNDSTNRYCTLLVKSEVHDGKQTLAVRGDFDDEDENVCYVVNADSEKENKLYNVMAREIEFQNTWDIRTSSYVVIHQINGCLKFGGKGGIYDSENKQYIRYLKK